MNEQNANRREKFLMTLLPAALVLMVYSFLVALPKQRSNQKTLDQLEQVKTSAIDEASAQQSFDNLRVARVGLARLKKSLNEDRVSIKDMGQQWRNLDSRLSTVEELTEMMGLYNLSIVSQDYQTEPTVSKYLVDLFNEINAESPAVDPVEYWQIEVEGGYAEVESFLNAIDKDRMKTFPISVNMLASETSNGVHTWTIIFVV